MMVYLVPLDVGWSIRIRSGVSSGPPGTAVLSGDVVGVGIARTGVGIAKVGIGIVIIVVGMTTAGVGIAMAVDGILIAVVGIAVVVVGIAIIGVGIITARSLSGITRKRALQKCVFSKKKQIFKNSYYTFSGF